MSFEEQIDDAMNKFLDGIKKPTRNLREDIVKIVKNTSKRPKEVEEEEEEEEEVEEVVKDFLCSGRVWEDPPISCPGGPKAHVKAGIQLVDENGKKKNVTVCHTCKLARQKVKRAEKSALPSITKKNKT